jgi:hypothetical protein
MGVGHLAAGLMLKKVDQRINLGFLFFAALLSDFLLGIFYYFGLEKAYIPPNYSQLHYLTFTFPYSHGLVATFIWSALVFILAASLRNSGTKIGIILAIAVFSHFILDAIVHIPELPVLGAQSVKLGFGLWNHMPIALALEIFLVLIGLVLYLQGLKQKTFRSKYGVLILMLIFSALTVMGMTSSVPPNLNAVAISWIAAPLIFSGLGFWLD